MKPITFRLYPEGRYRYCLVQVWSSRVEMIALSNGASYGMSPKSHGAFTCWHRDVRRKHPVDAPGRRGCFGIVSLYRDNVALSTVSHEMTHSAIEWARRVGIDPMCKKGRYRQRGEERFCYAVDGMLHQFSRQARRRGLIPA